MADQSPTNSSHQGTNSDRRLVFCPEALWWAATRVYLYMSTLITKNHMLWSSQLVFFTMNIVRSNMLLYWALNLQYVPGKVVQIYTTYIEFPVSFPLLLFKITTGDFFLSQRQPQPILCKRELLNSALKPF